MSLSPVLLRPQLAYLLSQFQYFVCPVGFSSETNRFTVECEPSDIFVMQEYTLPAVLQKTLGLVGVQRPLLQEAFVETFRTAADLHFCFCTRKQLSKFFSSFRRRSACTPFRSTVFSCRRLHPSSGPLAVSLPVVLKELSKSR